MTIDPTLLTGLGAALSVFLSGAGAAMASAHGGIYALRNNHIKALVPVVQAGVLAIYGIIVAILLTGRMQSAVTEEASYRYLAAGLSVGLASWASGWGMAQFLRMVNQEPAPKATSTEMRPEQQPLIENQNNTAVVAFPPPTFKIFVMALIFMEAIGLYGLIVALVLIGKE